jgi:ABC-type glycerol-3-phosphate transport system substrate-binding protein
MKRLRFWMALLALGLLLAACGSPPPAPHAGGQSTPTSTTSTHKSSGWG